MVNYKFDTTMKYKYTMNDNNEYHSFDDKPSLEYLDMSIISWHKDGKLHRIDKPALIRTLITGEIREEYYNDGKLHSYYDKDDIIQKTTKGNITIKRSDTNRLQFKIACIDGYYYMGKKLSTGYKNKIHNYRSNKYKQGCSICKNICKQTDLYNETFDFIYCSKCKVLNEIETINFEIKTFTNIEILELIKDFYNKNCPPDYKNRFIDINKITEDEITNYNNPNFITLLYYNTKKNIGINPLNVNNISICKIYDNGYDDLSREYELIIHNNKWYVPELLNFNNLFDIFTDEAIFNLDNIYILLTNKKIFSLYSCSCLNGDGGSNTDGNFNEYNSLFGFNILGTLVICDLCWGGKECLGLNIPSIHNSDLIIPYKKVKCDKCKKEDYSCNMKGHYSGKIINGSCINLYSCKKCNWQPSLNTYQR